MRLWYAALREAVDRWDVMTLVQIYEDHWKKYIKYNIVMVWMFRNAVNKWDLMIIVHIYGAHI